MNSKVKELMNNQITRELESAYLYLEFSNFFDSRNLSGYANYYRVQAKEEIDHAMAIYDYMHKANESVKLMVIRPPQNEYKSIEEILEENLKAEQDITNSINKIYDATIKNSDFSSKIFIQWFINEQLQEESSVNKMISDYKSFKDNLFELDKKYLERKHKRLVL